MQRRTLAFALTCAICVAPVAIGDDLREAYLQIDKAKSEAGPVPQQAKALVALAWPEEPTDPTVVWLARQQLVEFAEDSLPALRQAVRTVPERYQADVVSALLEARFLVSASLPQVFLPALEEALWFGSFEARRLVIPELAAHRYRPALITLMDTAYEYPALTDSVTQALGLYSNDKARHFLLDVMRNGTAGQSLAAAEALARIGGRALGALKTAVRDENPQARRSSIDSLLPISSINDLSLIYDFVAAPGSDEDPELLRRVTARAELLEILLDRQQQTESATAID